jgi:hypothetical protein
MMMNSHATTDVPDVPLDARVARLGRELIHGIRTLVGALPDRPTTPTDLARCLGVNMVLASRVLKATRQDDPIAVLHHSPGPEPLRRLVRAARRKGVAPDILSAAEAGVEAYDQFIRVEAGDRGTFDAMISAYLPEAREDFELRRRQAAFRANSELQGAYVDTNMATLLMHPSPDGVHLDMVWLFGLLGLRRLSAGATVKFASRRLLFGQKVLRPQTLDGVPVDGIDGLLIDEFCTKPRARLNVTHAGEVTHYTVAELGIGPRRTCDLVAAEVSPAVVPHAEAHPSRLRQAFAEVFIPSKVLVFDVLLHRDVYPGSEPILAIYDTAFNGIANINDPARDIDRIQHSCTIQPMGMRTSAFRCMDIPRYAELLQYVCAAQRWNGDDFRGYRGRIEHPIYGTQVVMAFDPPRQRQPGTSE